MEIKEVHQFDIYDKSEFIKIQNELKKKTTLKNTFNKNDIRFVAGVDLAYFEYEKKQYATCCIDKTGKIGDIFKSFPTEK